VYKIQEYVDTKNYGTFYEGGQFRYFIVISSIIDLISACALAKKDNKNIFILGGGSNVLFSDGVIDVFVIKIEIKGFEILNETDEYVDIKIGAGEVWDEIVEKIVNMNLSGLEALSAIPGTVGATPVQNVGAYGSEVKDRILEVEVFDINNKKIKILSNTDCKFGYRDSIFKSEDKGKYIITSVTYRLSKDVPKLPDYPGVKKYFIENNINQITISAIREAIINIRKEKLPNPKEIPNVGSFFKNPIINKKSFLAISRTYGEIPYFDIKKTTKQDLVKIPAGWLIENAGLKGKSFGNVSVYNKNALVLINTNDATYNDIIKARNEIIRIVQDKFGIFIEQEPEIV
jgi:UDP-N-acetylmuramate dehydrogenase